MICLAINNHLVKNLPLPSYILALNIKYFALSFLNNYSILSMLFFQPKKKIYQKAKNNLHIIMYIGAPLHASGRINKNGIPWHGKCMHKFPIIIL